jgi:4-diphosphocytidyl-2C-methyl-D-erythritol kinase
VSRRSRGIGERLTPMTLPSLWVAVLAPPIAVSTAAIFAARIDTKCRVGENGSLFRGLWAQ